MITPYLIGQAETESSPRAAGHTIPPKIDLPPLRVLADALSDLPTVARVVPDDGWGDPCSACPEPADGGPAVPHDAVAYIRRPFTVGTVTSVFREPVCAACLPGAIRWERAWRRTDVVHIDLIAGAS